MIKTFAAASIALMFVSIMAFGQTELFTPMKGSATPEFETSNAGERCLVFGKHIVKTTQSEDGGENVSIWNRKGIAKGLEACDLSYKPYATINDSDNNAFYGISAVYFFIDTGTSAGSRTLMVYKTDSGAAVTNVDYYYSGGEPRIDAARYLYYAALSNKKGLISTCPEAAKWRRGGGGVLWVQPKKLDLNTLISTNVGALRCAYQE